MGKAAFSAIIDQQLNIDHLNRRLEAAKKMEDEEEAEMEEADIANHMPWWTKAVEAYKKLLNNVARDWKHETVSSGMSLCLHTSVSAMATKALPMIGPFSRFIPP